MAVSIAQQILAEIDRRGATRLSIAAIYQQAIRQCRASGNMDAVDWPSINFAILDRYKPSGLNFIKRLAWSDDAVPR